MTNTDTPTEEPKKKNTLLWGCLIVLVLIFMCLCCFLSVVGLSAFTDFDPLGLNLDESIPWEEYIEDPSLIPDYEGDEDYFEEDSFESPDSDDFQSEESDLPLVPYSAANFPATFLYPEGWDVETEDSRIAFFDPISYTSLYVGMDTVDESSTAAEIAAQVMEGLQEDAEEGTFVIYENSPYYLSTGDDAYLSVYEWADLDGYWQFAYDLEIVSGDTNLYFFLVGEDPDDFEFYRGVMEDIAASISW